jgi:hypothetical protein
MDNPGRGSPVRIDFKHSRTPEQLRDREQLAADIIAEIVVEGDANA